MSLAVSARSVVVCRCGLSLRLAPGRSTDSFPFGSLSGQILIPYESIIEIAKTTTMVFQNALRINTSSKEEYTFTSFWGNHRDECFDLLGKIRKRVLLPGTLSSGPPSGGLLPRRRTITAKEETSPNSPQSTTSASSPEPEEQQSLPSRTFKAKSETTTSEAPPAPLHATVASPDENEERPGCESEERTPARSRLSSSVSDVDSIAPKDISMVQIAEASFPISADAFMETFLLDNAKFGLKEFNQHFGASEIKCNPWMQMTDTEPCNGTIATCMDSCTTIDTRLCSTRDHDALTPLPNTDRRTNWPKIVHGGSGTFKPSAALIQFD